MNFNPNPKNFKSLGCIKQNLNQNQKNVRVKAQDLYLKVLRDQNDLR